MRFTPDGGVLLVEHTRLTGEGDPAPYAVGWQRHLDLLAANLVEVSAAFASAHSETGPLTAMAFAARAINRRRSSSSYVLGLLISSNLPT